ncbi:hypothetical protein MRX96_007234 [Rhipicephalus microplus]
MGDEDIEIYAVAETHLRVKEEPPVHKSWQWAGLNHSAERHLPQSEYAAVAEAFEQDFQPTEPPTYDQFVLELRCIMKKHEIRVNSPRGA